MPLQQGHFARGGAPLGRRERGVIGAAMGALVVGGAALALVLPHGGGGAAGCLDVTVASTTGGAAIHACGDKARDLCAAPRPEAAIRVSCRRAGLG